MSRIKPVEPDARGSHLIQDRGTQVGMVIIPDVSPSLIVRHYQDNIKFCSVRLDINQWDQNESGNNPD
jgi:hypothetical protein